MFQFHKCDLASPTGPADAVKACHAVFGPRIDILQNIAGIMDTYNSADTFTDGTWDRVIAVNLTGPVKLMREVLQAMKSQGSGAIVNIASSSGTSGNWAGVAYTASKHGIVSFFSSQLSSVFRPYSISANTNRWELLKMLPGGSKMTEFDAMQFCQEVSSPKRHTDQTLR